MYTEELNNRGTWRKDVYTNRDRQTKSWIVYGCIYIAHGMTVNP